MGANTSCCSSAKDEAHTSSPSELRKDEAVPATDAPIVKPVLATAPAPPPAPTEPGAYRVSLDKSQAGKLGLDVDYMPERRVLPITAVTGGVAEIWNAAHPEATISKGDSILEVNGSRGNVAQMLELCKNEQVLELLVKRNMNYDQLVNELEELVQSKNCGPILIRLSWHDAGVFSRGERTGGCPNAAMRFTDAGEGTFAANAGLPTVALGLLAHISEKFCPDLISFADLWALAANVAIRVMGGPTIPTHFGRVDASSSADSVDSQTGRLPDGDANMSQLRSIFHPKGFSDKQIVTLSGAHTVGRCHLDRSGWDGPWTDNPLHFDNSYFKEMLAKTYTPEKTSKGCLQHKSKTGTIMLPSDLALLTSPSFRKHVDVYAADQQAFFTDFVECWTRLQENGCAQLRDIL